MTPLPAPKTKEQLEQEAKDYYKYMNRDKLIEHLLAYEKALHTLTGRVQFLYYRKGT